MAAFLFREKDARAGLLVPFSDSFPVHFPCGQLPASEGESVLTIGLPKV